MRRWHWPPLWQSREVRVKSYPARGRGYVYARDAEHVYITWRPEPLPPRRRRRTATHDLVEALLIMAALVVMLGWQAR